MITQLPLNPERMMSKSESGPGCKESYLVLKVLKYVMYDIIRSKVLLAYTLFLLLVSLSLFSLEEDHAKALISMMSIMLIVVPLVSIIFATTYFYNAYEFMELLVSQPIRRSTLLLGEFSGVALSLSLALVLGIAIPVLCFDSSGSTVILIMAGLGLSLSFSALAFLASVYSKDKARGIGSALLLWFYFAILYDALLLGFLFTFSDYPLEKAIIALASLNPIDLARIMILLKLDISALMGYTGALYRDFFGNSIGFIYSALFICLWTLIPIILSVRIFNRKNL